MKFSWQILNSFTSLHNINFHNFISKLTLSGFEVELIENSKDINDKIIHINITANRKEIYCIFNLAQEIQTIFNISSKISLIPLNVVDSKKTFNLLKSSQEIEYIKFNIIHNISSQQTPIWLKNYLKACNIQPNCLLSDIQKYIYIKWGQEIHFINLSLLNNKLPNFKLFKISNPNTINKSIILKYKDIEILQLNQNHKINIIEQKSTKQIYKNTLLCWPIYKKNLNNIIHNDKKTFNNAYIETIQILTTFGKAIINLSYSSINNTINYNKPKIVNVNINYVRQILGPTLKTYLPNEYLSYKQIIENLNQLKLISKYSSSRKSFQIQIPKSREHDLQRDIDIVEELGRIHGFKHFINKIPYYTNNGKISQQSFYKRRIRSVLNTLGLNEVINHSLQIRQTYRINDITIYNPITEDQTLLRTNIINNLISNYYHNIKQNNHRIEIFEIGKIFRTNKKKSYTEENTLSILIYNAEYFKRNWYDIPSSPSWFNAKGLIKIFLQELKADVSLLPILQNEIPSYMSEIKQFFESRNNIAIYSKQKNYSIGVFGKLNKKYLSKLHSDKKPVYIFQININELNKTIKIKKHIEYIMKPYSLYPSIIRDVSITLKPNQNIKTIKSLLLQNYSPLIESIKILNEYLNKISKSRSICLRITYRATNKTLTNNDINQVNIAIIKSLDQFINNSITI